MTQQEIIALARDRMDASDIVSGSIEPSLRGGIGAAGMSFTIETECAQYRITMEPYVSKEDEGYISGTVYERGGSTDDPGWIMGGSLSKKGFDTLWDGIEKREQVFQNEMDFYAGWSSAEDAQSARINAALDSTVIR